jgi:hypothetical protein
MNTYTRFLQSLVFAFLSIFVLFSNAGAQTGNLTGVVRNCCTNGLIAGVAIVCVVGPVMTNASGQFTLNGIPAGAQTLMATCAGYTSYSAPVVIIANQTTVYNFCMYPTPGILTGIITDCPNGNPILGAQVTWGTYSTYSTTGGLYSLSVYLGGTNALQVSKTGYDLFAQNGVTVTLPNTTTVNVQLNPGFTAPPNVTAALNAGQTAADITWDLAMSSVELAYDDYVAEQCMLYQNGGSISAVKFTPSWYPAVLKKCMLSVCGPDVFTPLQVNVYNADGPGGMPGTLLEGPVTLTPSTYGWTLFTFPSPLTITSGSFYIGMVQIGDSTISPGMSVDTTTNQLRSYQKIGSGPWVIGGGNYMIHAIMDEPCGLVPPGNITYTVSRLFQGQENTPAAWVQVGMMTGSYTITDNSWPSLPCGPYRWAVKPSFPCSGNTSPGFSNIIGKCWTATVTFHGQKCCAAMGKDGLLILAQNLDLPDTVYSVTTDTSGTAVIQNMWKGNYSMTFSVFGCTTHIMAPMSITGDMTMNIYLDSGPALPPINLMVCDTTLLATWFPPRIVVPLLDEKWTNASFLTNGWTVSGGTNWQISTGIGNPAPSAMFNWSPQVVGYDEYLTSKTITGTNSTILQLQYDIMFNSYDTTTVNTMAVEILDGSAWNTLKTYDNLSGDISWKREILNITPYTSQSFKIRFHAHGGNSYDINYWNIDNIKINASNDMTCLLGYTFYLNNTPGTFVTDTFYQIPPDQITWGQIYHTCVTAVYSYNPGSSSRDCFDFASTYVYPPLNFNADSIDCSAYLTWQKPHKQNGTTPPGLMGYNLFRGETLVHYCPSPDSLSYYDLNLDPGTYIYSCSAKYDMSVYGHPGVFGYSIRESAMDTAVIACGIPIPFDEGWNQNNFTYNGWTFDPSQGNWNTTSMTGNPLPSADFSWTGKGDLKTGNYDFAMVSSAMDGFQWDCSHLFLGFDLKLIDHFSGSTEKMSVEILYDNVWHLLSEYVNNGSFGWETETLNIDPARGKGFKIRFRAHGENTVNILHWYIDNIRVYGNCFPPSGLQWTATQEQVSLNWAAPCSSISGYNIFRSDSAGNSPFSKVNMTLVTGTSFIDIPPGWLTDDMYRYYVIAVQMNDLTGSVLCESGSDTVMVTYPVGIPEPGNDQVRIYPNPADNYIIIQSKLLLKRVEVMSNIGTVIYTGLYNDAGQVRINTTGFSQGIYFVRITSAIGTLYRKVVICR